LTFHQHNDNVVFVIPDPDSTGNLPPGRHCATWEELERRFGTNERRRTLLAGMKRMLLSLKGAGCRRAFIDGSFVTTKDLPSDFDGCWSRTGVDLALLKSSDPVLLDFSNKRARQKLKYGGEMFPAEMVEGLSGRIFLNFFSRDKNTGDPKGIIEIDLGGLA
jgi:hypothetical protein